MSLLLPNQLTVTLSLDSVAVIHQSRGLRSRILQQQHIAIAPSVGLDDEKSVWLQATRSLENVLALMQIKPKTTIQIIVANDFVRYLILPQQSISMRPAEQHAYAVAAYREVYGTVADGWKLKLHDAAPNQATIVAAIDEKLLETLKQISLKYQLKLVSVQPYLMRVFNSLSKQVGKLNGYIAIVESRRLLLLSMLQGQCQNLRTMNINAAAGGDWQLELKHLLARESLLGEITGREVLVYTPTQKNTKLNAIEGWHIRRVGQTDKKVVTDKQFALVKGNSMSHQLDFDFIHTPIFSLTRFSWFSLFLLVASLSVALFTWQTYQAKRVEHLGLAAKLVEINQQQKRKLPIKQTSVSIQPEQLKKLQETVNALAIPWNALFEAIEQSDQKDIALLSLEPNSQKQQIVITGEAKNLQVALAYIAQLEDQSALSQVFLQKHSIDEANVSKPVSFTVFAKWQIP